MYAQKGDSVNIMENKELALHAKNIRRNIVKEVYSAQSGHPGGSLGATDILTELYFEEMELTGAQQAEASCRTPLKYLT